MKTSTKGALKLAATAVVDFLCLFVFFPNLINYRDNLAFVGAMVCLVGPVFLTIAAVQSVAADFQSKPE